MIAKACSDGMFSVRICGDYGPVCARLFSDKEIMRGMMDSLEGRGFVVTLLGETATELTISW